MYIPVNSDAEYGSLYAQPVALVGQYRPQQAQAVTSGQASIVCTAALYTTTHGLGGKLTFGTAGRISAAPNKLSRLSSLLIDAGNQKPQLEIIFFNADPSLSTLADHAALTVHASDVAKICGKVSIAAADWATVGGVAVCNKAHSDLLMAIPLNALFAVISTIGTPTPTAITNYAWYLGYDS